MAYDLARQAERAFRFECSLAEGGSSYLRPVPWEGQRNGLPAGEALSVDLERTVKADGDSRNRGLENSKRVSLIELDPIAVLSLRAG